MASTSTRTAAAARRSSCWPIRGSTWRAYARSGPKSATWRRRLPPSLLAFRKEEGVRIPGDFDYAVVASLSAEVRQKLEKLRPATLAQASRMEGMTPAALMLLLAHLRKAPARKSA